MLSRFIFCFCYLQFDYPRNRLNENFFQEKPNLRKVFVFILQDINFHLPNLIMIRSSRSYVFRISHEKPVLESLFNKVAGREIYKFLRAPFSQSTYGGCFCEMINSAKTFVNVFLTDWRQCVVKTQFIVISSIYWNVVLWMFFN